MWWITVTDLRGQKMHVNIAHIRSVGEVMPGEHNTAQAKITWASGQVQFIGSSVADIMKSTIAWKFKGCV